MPTRTSSFRPRAPALPWLPPAGAEPLRRAAVASCLCQSRCRGSRDGAPSAGAEPVWRRCEVQPLRDGCAEPMHSGGLARSNCCSCAMAARGTRSSCLWRPGPGLHRQELSPRASYRPSRLHESADALVLVMHALGWNGFGRCAWSARRWGRETVAAATGTIQRRREQIRLSPFFFII